MARKKYEKNVLPYALIVLGPEGVQLIPGVGGKMNTKYLARLQNFSNLKCVILHFIIKNKRAQVIMVCHNVCLLTICGFGPLHG